VKTSGVNLF